MEVTINYNRQALSVEVTVEVYEYLDRADHKTENLAHEQRRHWDGREFDEYIAFTEGVGVYRETPEDYLCRKETLNELLAILDSCTEVQRRRFLLYALDGLSYSEIAARCGCSKYAVRDSIVAVRKIFETFLRNRPPRLTCFLATQ
ncbi:RNA polymerase sigma factor [Hominibacterium faecale]|uniref:RNA polymerase sigma factor n=1 Tax=Hominibacterium faecale TaxID=2839743 RepID=UPI0022B29D88|nr:sigma factor-like helix-turn-helix DNA-binding protein [Hominibacterium faecale]